MKKVFLSVFSIIASMACIENGAEASTIKNCAMSFDIEKYKFNGDSVYFSNPCYKGFPEIEAKTGLITTEHVQITNASMLNFSSTSVIGKSIRTAEAFNDVPNTLGLTHSGIVVNDNPKRIYETVLNLMPGGALYSSSQSPLSERAGKAIITELMTFHKGIISAVHCPEVKASFSIESDGSVGEVLKGISPHVHIHDLKNRINEYDGNIFIRPLNEGIPSFQTVSFLNEYVGRPYESIFTLKELLKSVKSLNTEDRVENVFCSELAAIFYRKIGILKNDIITNNATPELFGSGAGNYDLLKGFAQNDIPLKVSFEVNNSENTTETGCGNCFKGIFSCCGI